MAALLRIFPGYDDEPHLQSEKPSIRMRVGDLFPLLAQAHWSDLAWLNDFEDDDVHVTPDLYEVLAAYRGYRASA